MPTRSFIAHASPAVVRAAGSAVLRLVVVSVCAASAACWVCAPPPAAPSCAQARARAPLKEHAAVESVPQNAKVAVAAPCSSVELGQEKLKPCDPSEIASDTAQCSLEKLLYFGSTSRLKHVWALGSESSGAEDATMVSAGCSAAAPPSGSRAAPVMNCNSSASCTAMRVDACQTE